MDLMKRVPLDPPGSWCLNHAALQLVRNTGARTFLEVGCGKGTLSARLCKSGLTGTGVDFSEDAAAQAKLNLEPYLATGAYRLLPGDFMQLAINEQFEVVLSLMVMEHVKDDLGFLRRLAAHTTVGGATLVAVPGRPMAWSPEDEMAGHYRRYDKRMLRSLFVAAGLEVQTLWSVTVPVANLLRRVSSLAIRRSTEATRPRSQQEDTKRSGIWEVQYKTVFPAAFRVLLNRFTMAPFVYGQRLFYTTDWGLCLVALGRRPA
jgi:SAM-dependent methyltransferase